MVAPVARAGVEHVLREGINLRHLGHGPVERGVETSHLRQAGECLGQRTGSTHVVWLVRRLHDHERVEIGQHIGVDQHRRLEPCAAEHHPVSGRNHLHARDVLFEPGDDEMERGAVVDRAALAELVRIQRFAGRVLRNELRVGLHVADLAVALMGSDSPSASTP